MTLRTLLFMLAAAAITSAAHADTTTVSLGFGTTVFPTPVPATERLGFGGGGIIGGNVTLGCKASYAFSEHWRVPVQISYGFLRGNDVFNHLDSLPGVGKINAQRLVTNSSDLITLQAGLEYRLHRSNIMPYFGFDLLYASVGTTTLELSIPSENQIILTQSYPTVGRLGCSLHIGAEAPLMVEDLVYDVSAEVGALNLLNRSTGDHPTVAQLFTPTQAAYDLYQSRAAEGKGGEAVVTYIRLLVKVGWKFHS